MSGKLDQSLDQIMTDSKTARGARKGGKGRPSRAAATKAKALIAAPTGGVRKNQKPAKVSAPVAAALATAKESKIIVSNLPEDVTEVQIKDYFNQTIGSVKKVLLTYGPNGRSRGVATIFFSKAESATKAAKDLHGVKVDGKPMKIELVLGAHYAPGAPVPKTLAERASQPKSAAPKETKPAAGNKTKPAPAKGKKSGRAGRPQKKSAAELDAEMVDYFGGDGNAANNVAPAAGAGDAAMTVDEVL